MDECAQWHPVERRRIGHGVPSAKPFPELERVVPDRALNVCVGAVTPLTLVHAADCHLLIKHAKRHLAAVVKLTVTCAVPTAGASSCVLPSDDTLSCDGVVEVTELCDEIATSDPSLSNADTCNCPRA